MKKIALAAGVALALGASIAQAASPLEQEYVVNPGEQTVWRTSSGECWHTGAWTEENAVIPGCDGYAQAATPAPAPKAEPTPAPTYTAEEDTKKFALYFDFDSTKVGDVSAIVNYIGTLSNLEKINLSGHADFIGSAAYNNRLAKRRAMAVANKLSAAGVDKDIMEVSSLGEASPIANCSGRGAELIACLRPDRRVDVEIHGEKQVRD